MPRAQAKSVVTVYNDALLEGAAAADVVQAQLLVAVVFMAREPDRFLDHVRELGALRRRMGGLLERSAAAHYERQRRARSRL